MSPSRPRLVSSLVVALVVTGLGFAAPAAHATDSAHPEPAAQLLAAPGGLAAATTPAAIGPKVTRAQVMESALGWLAKDPAYSQSAYYPASPTPTTMYRTDCSGFVSMAWHVNVNQPGSISTGGYVTWTLPSIATRLASVSLLQPGDILDYPYHHVILFTGWVDRTAGTFSYIAETQPGTDMQMSDNESVYTGNISGYPHTVFIPYRYVNIVDTGASGVRGDWDSNGTVDLLARTSADTLSFYEGNGAGGFKSGRAAPIATGQSDYTSEVRTRSLSATTLAPDVVAVDKAGDLWVLPGTGVGSFGPRLKVASGLTGATLVAPGDFSGDGRPDLFAVTPDGALMLLRGTGAATFAAPVQAGRGWTGITVVGVGDFNSDGKADLLADLPNGDLYLYPGNGAGSFLARVRIGNGWAGYRLVSPGNFGGDANPDLVATDPAGELWLYPGTGRGTVGPRVHLGSHWGSITLL